jgi:hypothetical protein
VTINIADDVTMTWTTGPSHGSTPLIPEGASVKNVILSGGTFKALGDGVGEIRAANGGKLVFEDMTIVDESESYAETSWEFMYLEFSGEVDFKNCTFENGIMFIGDIVTFTGCTFTSPKSDEYGVWIDNGTASFNNCEFNGYRGLKIHEFYGSDISSVTVDNSTFGPLSSKPGVAIGTLDSSTAVTIKNSTFNSCQPGDQDMYIYESDTDTTSFNFTIENNTIIK